MTNQQKNRRILVLLFAMSIIPFCLAWYLSANTGWITTRTNRGELINPPVTTEYNEFSGYDAFSSDNMHELKGRWVLINIVSGVQCGPECLDAMHKSRQLRLMMSKDLLRIRRLALLMRPVAQDVAEGWWKEDTRLLRARPKMSLHDKIQRITGRESGDGGLLIMDPLGNLMLQYKPGFDPYDVKKDLGKLLRISQIG